MPEFRERDTGLYDSSTGTHTPWEVFHSNATLKTAAANSGDLLVTVPQGLVGSGGGFSLLPLKHYLMQRFILICFLCIVAKVQVSSGN